MHDEILEALKTLRSHGIDTADLSRQVAEVDYYSELAKHRPNPDYVLPSSEESMEDYVLNGVDGMCPWNIRLMAVGRQFSLTPGVAEALRNRVHEQVFPEVTVIDLEFKFGHLYGVRIMFHSASVRHRLWIRDIQSFMATANMLQRRYEKDQAEREAMREEAALKNPKKKKLKKKAQQSLSALLADLDL